MKKPGLLLLFLLAGSVLLAQEKLEKDVDGCPIFKMPEGDTVFIMKQYFMAFYKAGPNRNQDKLDIERIQSGHMDHIGAMDEAGILSIAGPFGHDGDLRGILIFNVPEQSTVEEWMEKDPAVQSGRLVYEVYPWWGGKGSTLK